MKRKNIYIIRNRLNDMVYVGQTKCPIYKRFCEHVINSYKENITNKFYLFMKKTGQENFYIELLEECNDKEANMRENFYIDKYGDKCLNEFHNFPLTKEQLEEEMAKMSSRKICKKYGIHDKSVVIRWCKIYGIDKSKQRFGYRTAPELTKDTLYEEYIVNNKSLRQIAKEYNVKSKFTIQQRLEKYNIKKAISSQ